MKYILNIVLALLAVVFMIYGSMQSIESSGTTAQLIEMQRAALPAEEEAIRQRDIAEQNRTVAEAALKDKEKAEPALLDCQKKKR